MNIGARLRQLRNKLEISQGVIEKQTGLLRCYISRVENGHTVPSVETLQKFANALKVPVYQIFYEGTSQPEFIPAETKAKLTRSQIQLHTRFLEFLPRIEPTQHQFVIATLKEAVRKTK